MRVTFKSWIDEVGPGEIARQLGVTTETVYNWRKRHCYPRVRLMAKILALSGGKLTLEMIVGKGLRR